MRYFLSLLPLILFSFAASVSAQSSEFNIRVAIDDVDPPTTPTLLSATPVSTSQIDIDWTVSTDNLVVSGYVLSRDGSPLATTTLTNYSDTGLAASTTYSYYVQAFDSSFNYSSTSNVIATTTLDTPTPELEATTTQSSQSTATRVVLDEVNIIESYTSSLFTIKTARPASIELRWGRTNSYELGYVVNNRFLSEYETNITGLEPGTTYEYEIIGRTPRGYETLLQRGRFTTLTTEETNGVSNVRRFRSEVEGSDVRLLWDLPIESNIQYVRILRNHFGFPTHLYDGAIVYQGLGGEAIDEGILDIYSPVYYTAFAVSQSGVVSSGAVLRVSDSSNSIASGEFEPYVPPILESDGMEIYDEQATTSDSTAAALEYRIPDITEVFVFQGENQYTFAYENILLTPDASFIVSIPRDAVSGNLKTIIASVVDPTDTRQRYSFLLKINGDQSAYEAVISPLPVVGESWLTVDIYDYESRVVSSYRKQVTFAGSSESDEGVVFPDVFIENLGLTVIILLLPLILLLLFLYRQNKKD